MKGLGIITAVLATALCVQLALVNPIYVLVLILFVVVMSLSVKMPYIFIMVLFMIFEQFFQTFNFGMPFWMYADIVVLILVGALFFQLIIAFRRNKHFLPINDTYFIFCIVLWGVILFSSGFGSYLMLGQSVSSFIMKPRWFFLLFVIIYLFNVDFSFEQIRNFYKFILVSAVAVSFFVIIDAQLLGGGVIFNEAMTNGVSGERAGGIRLATYVTPTIWALYYIMAMLKMEHFAKWRSWLIFGGVIILYQFFFCNMTRQLLVSVILTIIVYLCSLPNRLKHWSGVVLFSAVIIGIGLFLWTTLMSSNKASRNPILAIIEQTQDEVTDNKGGNIDIRRKGIEFYFQYLKKTWFLGTGVTSTTVPGSPEYEGGEQHFLMADIGLFAVLIRFGVPGLLLVLFLFWIMFRDVSYIMKYGNVEAQAIAEGIYYFLVGQVVLLPSSNIFFPEYETLHVGLLFYFISKMKSECKRDLIVRPSLKPQIGIA